MTVSEKRSHRSKRHKIVDHPDNLPPKEGQGRPPLVEFDHQLVYELAKIHCTIDEISSIVGVSRDTLVTRASIEMENGRNEGKRSLRRKQWEQAEKGNTVMLIWLGKQILKQRDKAPEEATQVHFNVTTNEIPVATDKNCIEIAQQVIRTGKKEVFVNSK